MEGVTEGSPEAEGMRKVCDFCDTPASDVPMGVILQTDGKVGICVACVKNFALAVNEIVLRHIQADIEGEMKAVNNTRKDLN